MSSLHVACQSRDKPIIRALLAAGAVVNIASDVDGSTPLHAASRVGSKAGAKILLAAHANPDLQTLDGSTALLLAALAGHTRVVKLLLEKGANPNICNNVRSLLSSRDVHVCRAYVVDFSVLLCSPSLVRTACPPFTQRQ